MKNQAEEKKNRRLSKKTRLVIYSYLLLFLLIISVTATYTWFSLSRTPQVSNLSMYVTSRSGLELALSPDSEEWGSQLSYLDMTSKSFPLRPVTWSEKDQRFYAAEYAIDGRLSGNWHPLSDDRNANRDNRDGYYSIGTFYARTSEDVTVSLTSPVEMAEGISGSGTYLIGTPLWDADKLSHINAGQGAENAVRIGIQITHLNENNNPIEQTKKFYIYEPNCDTHADEKTGYIETPSIDGDSSLVPSERLIIQTHSSWTEANPVENGVQVYTIGDFETPTELFALKADQKVMIKLYLWLEGQDVDCTNAIREAQIIANVQFKADPEGSSGLQPIR
ncbi:MAG: hypothetical protein E7539_01740 [Ruminococcaceae bacterium]|nr:hypothetical protein [Oscillospiraceae bacterium]